MVSYLHRTERPIVAFGNDASYPLQCVTLCFVVRCTWNVLWIVSHAEVVNMGDSDKLPIHPNPPLTFQFS